MIEYKTINQLNKQDKKIAMEYINRFSSNLLNYYPNYNEAFKNTNDKSLIQEWNETISYLIINDNIYVDCCDEALVEQIVDWEKQDDDAVELFKNIRYLNIKLYTIKER